MKDKIIIGKVAPAERDEIQILYERKKSLKELKVVLPREHSLYPRMLSEIEKTNIRYNAWWDEKGSAYGWPSGKNIMYEIDFETCDIFLITTDEE